ncbi:MAG: glycosyltransferase [Usitatibacter sp.]
MIDVVIACYRGLAETRTCIESVLAARTRVAREIVVIDDASPEPALSQWLRELGRRGRVTLIEHAANRGFVATANEGMALHRDRDVVLLNSDTEVSDGWLDRLAAHAADAAIGTVTPFSNNATVCSYPLTFAANELPRGETTASLDAAFAAANAGLSADIPTAVGFCMFIARRCLDRVGFFDEGRYGTGYGEEVDFCMRASRAGFRNVIAADVFVKHVGEVSFGSEGGERRARAQATVDALYPEFQVRLREHIARDPVRVLRRRADLERLRRSTRPLLLFVIHRYGGGVRRHVEELAAAASERCDVLILSPYRRSYASLTWLTGNEELALWFHHEEDWDRLIGILRAVGVSRVHYHHVHGLPMSILDLSRRLGCPHDVTIHDYYPVCPRYHLTDATGRYCEEKGENGCMRCLDAGPIQWPVGIVEWRERFHALLVSAARVIAPSADAAARIGRYFPDVRPVVWPHPYSPHPPTARPFMVLVPGGLSREKGIDVLESCALDAKARGLPLHFRVIGFVARPLAPWPELPVTLTGEYRDETLPARIALEGGDAIFLPAQVPETFSYTLSAAMDSGLPIVATDLGALPERLAGYAAARIVAWNASPASMNDALMEVAARAPRQASASPPAAVGFEEYLDRYFEAIDARRAPATAAIPALDEVRLVPPFEAIPEPTLVELFDDGVLCGKASSLVELRAGAMQAQLALAEAAAGQARSRDAQKRLADAEARVLQTHAALRSAEARLADIEASTSWKATGPLRRVLTWLRGPR